MNRRLHPSVQHVLAETEMVRPGSGLLSEAYESDPMGEELGSVALSEFQSMVEAATEIDRGLDELVAKLGSESPEISRVLRRLAVAAEDLKQDLQEMEQQHHGWKGYREEKENQRGLSRTRDKESLRSLRSEKVQRGKAATRLTRNRDVRRERRRKAEAEAGASQIPRP